MKIAIIVLLVACGAKQQQQQQQPPAPSDASAEPVGVVKDTRPEIVKRRDTACEQIGPKLTQCAVEDARVQLAAGKITQQQFTDDTKPEVQRALTKAFLKKCKRDMSSRQVRVLEVCFREEQECGPLATCLENLQPK